MAASRWALRSLIASSARLRSSSAIRAGILLHEPSPRSHRRLLECGNVDRSVPSLWTTTHRHFSTAMEEGENLTPVEEEQDPFAREYGFSQIFAKKHIPELLKPQGQAKLAPVFSRLRSFGVEDVRLKALVKDNAAALRTCDSSSMEENLSFLRRYVLADAQISEAVKKHPAILVLSVGKDLEPKVKFLMEQGFATSAITAILSSCPATMSSSIKDFTARIAFLTRCGMDRRLLGSCVVKHPSLLSYDPATRLRPVITALNARLPKRVVNHLIVMVPGVFGRKPDTLNDLLDAFKYLGFYGEDDAWVESMSWGVRFGAEAVRDKIDFFMSMDIPYRRITALLKVEPHILQVDNAVLKEKLDFLFKEMKLEITDLIRCPAYLSRKSMDRVKVRWKVLSLLKTRGIINRVYLKDMVTLPRKWFVETFVFKYPDCGRIYYGERSAIKQARADARGEKSTSYY